MRFPLLPLVGAFEILQIAFERRTLHHDDVSYLGGGDFFCPEIQRGIPTMRFVGNYLSTSARVKFTGKASRIGKDANVSLPRHHVDGFCSLRPEVWLR